MADDAQDLNVPITTVGTATEQALADAQARVADLQAKKDQEDAARAALSPAIRRLAVALHQNLCVAGDAGHLSQVCTWPSETANPDDPALADWGQPQHQRWATIASAGVSLQRAQGWSVTEPS